MCVCVYTRGKVELMEIKGFPGLPRPLRLFSDADNSARKVFFILFDIFSGSYNVPARIARKDVLSVVKRYLTNRSVVIFDFEPGPEIRFGQLQLFIGIVYFFPAAEYFVSSTVFLRSRSAHFVFYF